MIAILFLGACSDDDDPRIDAAPPADARPDQSDAVPADAAPADAAPADAAPDIDAAPADAGPPDANTADAAVRPPVNITDLRAIPGGVHGMAVAEDTGRLYLSDSFRNQDRTVARVYYLDPPYTGELVDSGITGQTPAGLLWENGFLLVCNTGGGAVRQYDDKHELVKEWTAASPWNIARASNGDLLTVSFDGQVQKLNDDGTATTLFQGLDAPFDLAPAPDGTVWVSEQGQAAGKVTRRSLDGTIVETIDYPWANPEGLLLDDQGTLWIAETERDEIVRYDSFFGAEAAGMGYNLPVSMARVSANALFVNQANGPARLLRVEVGP